MQDQAPTGARAFVEPAYGDRSLGDVLPAIAAALGVDVGFHRTSLVLPPARAYVVFLVDGLGHRLVAQHAEHAPYLHALLNEPGVAGVPSTTATSLTSLGTALTPGQHGLVGFTSRIPGTEKLLNALLWDKQVVDPAEWQPNPTAFGRLRSAGVHATVVSKREFADSGLTLSGFRGAEFVGADKIGERIAGAVTASAELPSVTYVYDGDLDWTGHRYGVDSPQWRAQLSAIDASVEQLREALDPGVRLVVVADHGMVDSPAEARIDVDEHPDLRAGVHLLGGEARFRHLYCSSGAIDDVLATWRELLGARATVLSRDEAIERGWFGTVVPQVRPRLGDVVVAAQGDHTLISTADFPYENMLIGFHGSLTAVEMEIPILIC
ncbi:alkaline phosphatase family protein [Marmoricola sp. RAF53]|uniref:alkaline phosphatase family protein n=1 Tax=Marmoricola sp. RAF53 TaxID=3233059 RepID=UPI003F962F28